MFLCVVGRLRLAASLQATLETYTTGGENSRSTVLLLLLPGFLGINKRVEQVECSRWWLRKACTTVAQKHSSSSNVSSSNGLSVDSISRRAWSSLSVNPPPACDLMLWGNDRRPQTWKTNRANVFRLCSRSTQGQGVAGGIEGMWPSTVFFKTTRVVLAQAWTPICAFAMVSSLSPC